MNVRKSLTSKQELSLIKRDIQMDELLSVYPEESLERLVTNKDKLEKIAAAFQNTLSTVSQATLVMKCDGSKCPFKDSCILVKYEVEPNGFPCPIERKLCMELESTIVDELEIDRQSTIEMELLYDFIDAKLLDMRTSGLIASSSVVQWIEIDNGKSVNKYKDVAPEFKVKMDLKKLKFTILEEFVATRKAKRRYGLKNTDNVFESIVKNAMGINSGDTKTTGPEGEVTG